MLAIAINKMKELILLRGVPGAGKSTFGRTLSEHHIESDMYFIDPKTREYKFNAENLPKAHKWCQHMVDVWMDDSIQRIVVSNTFTQEWEMEPYFKIAEEHGYRVYSLIVENRHGNPSVHTVPEETITKMKERFTIQL